MLFLLIPCRSGGMADAADSKSVARKGVWVRLPPPAPLILQLDSTRQGSSALPSDSSLRLETTPFSDFR